MVVLRILVISALAVLAYAGLLDSVVDQKRAIDQQQLKFDSREELDRQKRNADDSSKEINKADSSEELYRKKRNVGSSDELQQQKRKDDDYDSTEEPKKGSKVINRKKRNADSSEELQRQKRKDDNDYYIVMKNPKKVSFDQIIDLS